MTYFRNLWLSKPLLVVVLWFTLSMLLSIAGLWWGAEKTIPGPANKEILLRNVGEQVAFSAGLPPRDHLLVLLSHPRYHTDDVAFIAARDSLVTMLRTLQQPNTGTKLLEKVVTTGHTLLSEERYITPDKKGLLLSAITSHNIDESMKMMAHVPTSVQKWKLKNKDFKVNYLSNGTFSKEIFQLIDKDLDSSLIYTIPLTFIVLLWGFNSLVAACLPLIIALVSLCSSLGCASLISNITGSISATASQLVMLLVLAVGVDYSLFIVSRVREEVTKGALYKEAILTACSTTGVSVLWSGFIVATSLSGLFLMRDSVLTSMAMVSIIAVLITMIGAVFVLPGILLLLDSRLEWGRLRLLNSTENSKYHKHFFHGWIHTVVKRPLPVMLLSVALLLSVSYFAFSLRLGSTIEPQFSPPSLQGFKAYSELKRSFPELVGVDFSLILHGQNLEELEETGQLDPFYAAWSRYDTISQPIRVERSLDGSVQRYYFIATGGSNNLKNHTLVRDFRNEVKKKYLAPLKIEASLSGTLPFTVDEVENYLQRSPLVYVMVIGVSIIFLLIAFRSLRACFISPI
jgi:hypothetical protein